MTADVNGECTTGDSSSLPSSSLPSSSLPSTPAELATALEVSTSRLISRLRARSRGSEWAAAPSLLPGWTRAHLLAHLAGNAAGISRAVGSALDGAPQPSYDGPNGRERGIESGAHRPVDELVEAVARSAADLRDQFERAAAAPGEWDVVTVDRGPVAESLGFRWREVEIHGVDLVDDYGPSDWPETFVAWLLPTVRSDWTERLGHDVVGTVQGDDRAVLAWAIGRPSGAQGNGQPWPELPNWD